MTSKKSTYPTPAYAEADRYLETIRDAMGKIARGRILLSQELRRLTEGSAEYQDLEKRLTDNLQRLKDADRDLKVFEEEHREEFFGAAESCRVTLPEGCLVYERTTPVIKRKSLTPEVLEAQGFPEAVKTARSVDWDLLENWPDERLWLVGTERKVKEIFGYEIVTPQAGTPAPPEEAADGSGGAVPQGPG